MVASDGGIFAFGDAHFYGSMGGQPLNQPVVGMAADARRRRLLAGGLRRGVFAFGDATFYGSMGGQPLNAAGGRAWPPTGGTATGWSAADGGLFSFGNAPFYGSMPQVFARPATAATDPTDRRPTGG